MPIPVPSHEPHKIKTVRLVSFPTLEERKRMGITDQLVRLAIGIENAEDLIADLEQALTVVSPAKEHAHAD